MEGKTSIHPLVRLEAGCCAFCLEGMCTLQSEACYPWDTLWTSSPRSQSQQGREHPLHVQHTLPDTMVASSHWGLWYYGFGKFLDTSRRERLTLTAVMFISQWQTAEDIRNTCMCFIFTPQLQRCLVWVLCLRKICSWTGISVPLSVILSAMKEAEGRWWFLSWCSLHHPSNKLLSGHHSELSGSADLVLFFGSFLWYAREIGRGLRLWTWWER